LSLDGPGVTDDRFIRALSAFTAVLHDVAESVTGERRAFRWLVTVREGSLLVDFTPETGRNNAALAANVIDAIDSGFEILGVRPERPAYWSDHALRKAKDLSETVDAVSDGVDHVSVRARKKQPRRVTRRTAANIEALIGVDVTAHGTIEGRLRTVTEGGGLHIVVQDALTLHSVRCYISEDQTEEILGAFRKRVVVYGEIRYRRDRTPVSIKVERFRILKDPAELPSALAVRGILNG
jgi:hypothetical protein